MFITKQLDILPPHLEENMYDVNMLLKEIFSDNDTEISSILRIQIQMQQETRLLLMRRMIMKPSTIEQ
jgi:hypothetical protein